MDERRQLWRVGQVECVMMSCCTGAELQLRRVRLNGDGTEAPESDIFMRELYPTRSDLHERARSLEIDYRERARDRSRQVS